MKQCAHTPFYLAVLLCYGEKFWHEPQAVCPISVQSIAYKPHFTHDNNRECKQYRVHNCVNCLKLTERRNRSSHVCNINSRAQILLHQLNIIGGHRSMFIGWFWQITVISGKSYGSFNSVSLYSNSSDACLLIFQLNCNVFGLVTLLASRALGWAMKMQATTVSIWQLVKIHSKLASAIYSTCLSVDVRWDSPYMSISYLDG